MVNIDQIKTELESNFIFGKSNRKNPYTINSDGSVDVHGNIKLRKPMKKLNIKFRNVDGTFWANKMDLTSCENVPYKCAKLDISNNNIESLEGCGAEIEHISVMNNNLTNVRGCPSKIDTLELYNNPLTSFDGLPESTDSLYVGVTWDPKLPLLKLLVATTIIITKNNQTNLEIFEPVQNIIAKFEAQGLAGSFACAHELELAGFKDNARW